MVSLRGACGVAGLLACAAAWPAGAQWTFVESGTTAELRGLSAPSAKVVWASGARGTVARSVDGGATWRSDTVAGAARLDFRSIAALDSSNALIASAGDGADSLARIYRTTDGGRSWQLVYSTLDHGVFLDGIAFWDARHGIALSDPVGGRFVLLTTDDGGRHWSRVPASRAPATIENEAAFAASASVLVVAGARDVWIASGGGARSRVHHSSDRGRSWTVSDTPIHAGTPASGIFALAASDVRHVIVVGGDYTQPRTGFPNVARSSNGGARWQLAGGPTPEAYLSGVALVPRSATVVAVGLAGTFLSKDGGERWTPADTTPLNAVRFAGARAGWAVGPHGRIGRWSEWPPATREGVEHSLIGGGRGRR